MIVLGVIGFGENPTACLLKDGKLIALAEEERFTRLKGSDGMFPAKALAYCLSSANLPLQSVDRIAFGWDTSKYPWKLLHNFMSNYVKYKKHERRAFHRLNDSSSAFSAVQTLLEYHPSLVRSRILEGIRAAGLKGDCP